MRIGFVIPSFGPGGAERVGSLLCNFWSEQGHSVTAITFDAPATEPFYKLDRRVALRQINAFNVTRNPAWRLITNGRRLYRLRSAFRALQLNVVVSFMTEANIASLCAAYGLGIPVIVSERNQPDRPGLGRLRRALRQLCYPMSTALVVQTEEIARWAERLHASVYVLPNPVRPIAPSQAAARRRTKEHRLVAVGRLVPQKGYDLLIESFASLADAHPDWNLVIYGEGPARASLESRIGKLGLTNRVSLLGFRKDIEAVLDNADLFVHPSRFEGYPNALIEALAAGCAVVASACPGGTVEILDGGRYGLLVPREDVEALTGAIGRMMSDPTLRATYAECASQAVAHLNVEVIGARWLQLMGLVCGVESARGSAFQ